MTTPPNRAPDLAADYPAPAVASAVISPAQLLLWSIRRELWEFRSIYIAPLAVAALILFGFLLSTVHRPVIGALDPAKQMEELARPYDWAALMLMATTFIVAVFYCLDALYGERRDRSILFWKSLPVSDLTTVLAKASIPIVVLPLITFAIIIGTQWIMLLMNTAARLLAGRSAAELWMLPWLQMSTLLFFHLLLMHGLYYAPFYGWLLMVSGWAKRAPILWAAIPVLAIAAVEKIAFNTSHFASLLGNRFAGGDESLPAPGEALHATMHFELGGFLTSPGLWIGLALTAAFLAAAVRLRCYREPI